VLHSCRHRQHVHDHVDLLLRHQHRHVPGRRVHDHGTALTAGADQLDARLAALVHLDHLAVGAARADLEAHHALEAGLRRRRARSGQQPQAGGDGQNLIQSSHVTILS
jgi:hypothetical protein